MTSISIALVLIVLAACCVVLQRCIAWLLGEIKPAVGNLKEFGKRVNDIAERIATRLRWRLWINGAALWLFTYFVYGKNLTPVEHTMALLLVAVLVLCFFLYYFWRRVKQAYARPRGDAEFAKIDSFVLYLRSFELDESRDYCCPWNMHLEEYISSVIEPYGRLVAIGIPEEDYAPAGALRVYSNDDEWRTRFMALAARASGFVILASRSNGLLWEWEQILRIAEPSTVLVVFSNPLPLAKEKKSFLANPRDCRWFHLATSFSLALTACQRPAIPASTEVDCFSFASDWSLRKFPHQAFLSKLPALGSKPQLHLLALRLNPWLRAVYPRHSPQRRFVWYIRSLSIRAALLVISP